jgi:hypothetical protein
MTPIFLRLALLSLAAGATAACTTPYSEVPVAVNFPTTKQEKLQSAHHWQVVAQAIAARLTTALQQEQECRAQPMICSTVAVATSDRPSPFEKGLAAALTTELVQKGWKVRTELPAEIVVRLDIQAHRFQNRPADGKFTSLAALGVGLWVVSDDENIGIWRNISPGAAVLTGLTAYDIWRWQMSEFAKGPTPEVELIVSAAATREGIYLARTTDVFFVADSDVTLYLPPPAPAPLPAPAHLPVHGS